MTNLLLEQVNKTYADGRHAVRDLDLEIADGEFLVLAGPSGSGKSTALRLVAGLEEVTSGTLSIGGRVVNSLSPRDRDVTMVFQSYALYPHMTVADNISYGLRIRGLAPAEIKRRVDTAAEILDLGPLLERHPRQLTAVERQRIALGRAIVREPQVFLMDDPLASLSTSLREQLRADILQVQQTLKITTIYATPDRDEALTLGDRVALLNNGQLQQIGTPQQVYDSPGNVFTAGFLGSPRMNLALAHLPDQQTVSLGPTQLPLPAAEKTARPALAGYAGQDVVLGIRPEHLTAARPGAVEPRPAKAADPGEHNAATPRLRARVEELTSATMMQFRVAAGGVLPEETTIHRRYQPEAASKASAGPAAGTDSGVRFFARLPPGHSFRVGDEVDLAVDTGRLHFFDPHTGAAIR